ncbi:MAG: hypothetical protein KKB50_03170 [Planctomycetes bacterium]|nr:hypothetical protein [Planctomycetota bacterium]
MVDHYVPRPDAQFNARQNNVVTCVNGHMADLGLAAGVMRLKTIRAAPVRKRLARYAKNIDLSPPPLPHGRGSDRNAPPADPSELSFLSVDARTP